MIAISKACAEGDNRYKEEEITSAKSTLFEPKLFSNQYSLPIT
jgi:hypothetical protein